MSVSNYILNQRISTLQYQIHKLQYDINLLQNEIIQPTLFYSSTAIYGFGNEPSTSLNIRNNHNYSGWHFTNSTSKSYINWSFPLKENTLVSNLKGICISFFNGNTTSNDDILFLQIQTVNGSMTYIFDQTISPTINTNYQGVCIIDKLFVPYNNETQIKYKPSTITGNYSQNDKILTVVIGTHSSSASNTVQFVANKLNLLYHDNITQSYLLVSP